MRFWPLLLLVAFLVGAAVYSEGMKTRAQVGQPAPDFTLQTLDGTRLSLSDFRGRPVIVYFWATWCPSCRQEAPAHRAFQERFGHEVTYLALNLREPADKVRAYREEFAARGLPLLRTELLDRQGRIYDLYRATGTPETWIIDGQGRAVRHFVGPTRFEDLVAAVEEAGIPLWRRPEWGWVYAASPVSPASAASPTGHDRLWWGSEEGIYALQGLAGTAGEEARGEGLRLARLPVPLKDVRSLSAAADRPVLWAVGQLGAVEPGAPGAESDPASSSPSAGKPAAGERVLVSWDGDQWQVYLREDDPLAVAAGPGGRVYAWTGARGLLASFDGGETWQELETPYRPQAAGVALAVDPHHPAHLLSAGPGGLWQSRDGGRTWSRTEVETSVSAIAFHPHRPGEVWFTHQEGVLVSRDGGRTAQPLDGSPQRSLVGLAWLADDEEATPLVLAANGDVYAQDHPWRLLILEEALSQRQDRPQAEGLPRTHGFPQAREVTPTPDLARRQDPGWRQDPGRRPDLEPPPVEAWVEGWESGAGLEVGQVAPDFLLPDASGRWFRLSDFRGEKAVLINFWATWCPPCREEMPQFEQLYRSRGHELAILAVNLRESAEDVESFFEELDLTFPALLDADGRVSRRYNIRPMPTSYVVDKQGVIRGRYFGFMPPQVLHGLVELAVSG